MASALVLFVGPWRALSQLPPQLRVHWEGAADCPRSAAFDSELAHLLGGTAQTIEASTVHVRVGALSVSDPQAEPPGVERGYRLSLTMEIAGSESERVVELPTCSDVPRTAALLVATALEQGAIHERPQEAREQAPSAPRSPVAQSWSLRLGALGDAGSLPGLTAGPLVGLQWSLAQYRVWLDGRYLLARARADDDSRLVGKIDLFAGALGVARLWNVGGFLLGPLLEAELGSLRGRAHGGELARAHASAFWGSAQLGAVLERALGERVSLALAAQASLPWSRPQFGLLGEPAFYTTGHVAARLGLSVRVKLVH